MYLIDVLAVQIHKILPIYDCKNILGLYQKFSPNLPSSEPALCADLKTDRFNSFMNLFKYIEIQKSIWRNERKNEWKNERKNE